MNNEIPKAVVEKRKRSNISWLIPLIALMATSWLIYKSISEAGVDIIVNFGNGNGFKAGKTAVVYKGYKLGKITKITIGKDLKSVNAHININKDAANFINREGTEFWIVKPKFSVSEISGLDTIVGGVYIEVKPKTINQIALEKIPKQYKFMGSTEKPFKYYNEEGLNITLKSKDLSGINNGTPIFYKKFKIGEVIASKLEKNGVDIFINIQKKYENLINRSSVFWNISGIKINAGLKGVNIEMDSFTSLISGGITFETFDDKAPKIEDNNEFVLYKNIKEVDFDKTIVTFILDNAKGLEKNSTPIVYKGVKIGVIKSIELDENNKIIAKASLEKKFSKFNNEGTKYHKVDAKIDLTQIKNLDTLIHGIYINIIPGVGKYTDTFTLYDSSKSIEEKEVIDITIKSDKLYNLKNGSKIYYKNIQVGMIKSHQFSKDLKHILINVHINMEYQHLINDRTLFYSISSTLIESKNFNFKVNFEGIDPFINGGIGLEYTKSNKQSPKNRYWLYESLIDLLAVKQKYSDGIRVKIQTKENIPLEVNAPIYHRNTKIGFIEQFVDSPTTSYAVFFIEKEYKKLVHDYSKFYMQKAIEAKASLAEGINIKVGSLQTLLRGSIILTNSFKTIDKEIKKSFQYKLYNDFENLPIKKYSLNLTFENIEGLNANSIKLMYKGIKVGKITSIKLNRNLKQLDAKAYVYENFKNLCLDGSSFYIVKPDISLKGVSGLDTIIKGSYVNIVKGVGKLTRNFDVYTKKPSKSTLNQGKRFTLRAKDSGSLSTSSLVYYKKINIGVIEEIDLDNNAKYVTIKVFIYKKYQNLIRENTKFYNVSGIDIDLSLLGANIRADSLNTVVFGGISFSTPNSFGNLAKNNTQFRLYKKAKEAWLNFNPEILLNKGK
ncbi:MAG: MCE family protein [Campylobacteraceae bacterium]|nr:MCE family protein [Campylobacteraceae bacterium]